MTKSLTTGEKVRRNSAANKTKVRRTVPSGRLQMSVGKVEDEFNQFLSDKGLAPADGYCITSDGRWHNYRSPTHGNCSAILNTDGCPRGTVQSWRTGERHSWTPVGVEITKEDRRRFERENQKAEASRQLAARKAQSLYDRLGAAKSNHPYLRRKEIGPGPCKVSGCRLVVPIHDALSDEIISLQWITQRGEKRFMFGGRTKRGCCPLGKIEDAAIICEGYATAASLHEATGFATVAAFSAGNLRQVAEALRIRYPACRLIIAADNDANTEGNPGQTAAREAATACGAVLAVPSIPGDFNDLAIDQGPEAVRDTIEEAAAQNSQSDPLPPLPSAGQAKEAKAIMDSSSSTVVEPPGEPMPNARRFLRAEYHHDERDRLIHQGGQFYRWDGTCWPPIEDPILRAQLYQFFEEKVYLEGKKCKPFAPTSTKVGNLLDALRAVTIVPTETPTPSWLGKRAPAPAEELIACENGLCHWPTRMLHPHTPRYYAHHSVPFAFDPQAPSPTRWLKFLAELWDKDAEMIETLQELFGYLISGDTRQQKMFLLVGPKRSGKGTIARVLTAMLGRHNAAGPTLASLAQNFGLQDLVAKSVAIISDARLSAKTDRSIVTERLLSISGEDMLTIDRKYRDPWSGQLPTRIVLLTNELPQLSDSSGALASRFVVFVMTRSFYGRENPELTGELCQELPSIFNWALDGLERLRARGRFVQPSASEASIRQLEDLGSPVAAFVRDQCCLGPQLSISTTELYEAYRDWCDTRGHRKQSNAVFGRGLSAAHPQIGTSQPKGPGGGRIRVYTGIKLGRPGNTLGARVLANIRAQRVRQREEERREALLERGT